MALMDAIKAIRVRRNEMGVPASRKASVYLATQTPEVFQRGEIFFQRLASASEVTVGESFQLQNAVSIVTPGATVSIPFDQLIDIEKELERLNKEKERLQGEIRRVEGKLQNQGFLAKAPAKLVEGEREKAKKFADMLAQVEESIASLTK